MGEAWVSKAGAWKKVTDIWVSKGGAWKKVDTISVSKAGAWKSGWSGTATIDAGFQAFGWSAALWVATSGGTSTVTFYQKRVSNGDTLTSTKNANPDGTFSDIFHPTGVVPGERYQLWAVATLSSGQKISSQISEWVPPMPPAPPQPTLTALASRSFETYIPQYDPAGDGLTVRYAWRSFATGPLYYTKQDAPSINWTAGAGTSWSVQVAYEVNGKLGAFSPVRSVTTLASGAYARGSYYILADNAPLGYAATYNYTHGWRSPSDGLVIGSKGDSYSDPYGASANVIVLWYDKTSAAAKAVYSAISSTGGIVEAMVCLYLPPGAPHTTTPFPKGIKNTMHKLQAVTPSTTNSAMAQIGAAAVHTGGRYIKTDAAGGEWHFLPILTQNAQILVTPGGAFYGIMLVLDESSGRQYAKFAHPNAVRNSGALLVRVS